MEVEFSHIFFCMPLFLSFTQKKRKLLLSFFNIFTLSHNPDEVNVFIFIAKSTIMCIFFFLRKLQYQNTLMHKEFIEKALKLNERKDAISIS